MPYTAPELRQDSTAVNTTKFITSAAKPMCICSNAATYGDSPSSAEFHGKMVASKKIEPTKKMITRSTTELVALTIARSGSSASAAAIVAILVPTIEKITTTMPENSAPTPCGKNPSWAVRLEKSISLPGHRPRTNKVPSTMKITMVATFTPANQYSNSP
jgi:hypothetical protein